MRFELKNQILLQPISANKVIIDVFLTPLGQQLFWICFERIDPCIGLWWCVVPIQELDNLFSIKPLLPSINQPLRMGIAQMRLISLKIRQCYFCGGKLAQVSS